MAGGEIEAVVESPPLGAPVPAGTVLRADSTLEWVTDSLVSGGSPWRLLRLTEHGAALLSAWEGGQPVSGDLTEASLARRLVDAGLLQPSYPDRAPAPGEVDIVIPVRDDPEGLDAVLRALGATPCRVLVVDDASEDGAAVRSIASTHGATVVRRDACGGPGAARNTGFAATGSPIVAFLDADTVPGARWLHTLLPHFDDPSVAAVAPRVRGPAGPSARERFEEAASPLDLGDRPGVVRPGSAVPFVPSAAIVVRRSALGVPFDESLSVGEDVDLVWRLAASGWLVRYEPAAVVTHAARPTWLSWLSQRFSYGLSACDLEARHGDAAAPLRADPRVLATLALVLAGRPRAALGVLSWSATSMARQLEGVTARGGNESAARQIAVRGTALAAPGLARSTFRTYGPVLLGAAVVLSPIRRPVAALAVAATAVRWWRAGRPAGAVSFAALSIADDLAYGAGVVAGAVRSRRAGALLPRLGASARTVTAVSRT